MFTGIVQETGTVRGRSPAGEAVRFSFDAPRVSETLSAGDSVACDGVCLTVERREPSGFTVCAVPETLARTTLGSWKAGDAVNLEAAVTPSTPMGGHFVLGHVDGVCGVEEVRELGEGGRELRVRLPAEFLRYCACKGSLALAGVSLTIAAVDGDSLRFAVIPHTLASTTLGKVKAGDRLHFEVDILAKYVERLAGARHPSTGSTSSPQASAGRDAAPLQRSDLTETALREWGYAVP